MRRNCEFLPNHRISLSLFSLQFGLIYGGAQKNIGCAGVTVVIIRSDLIGYSVEETPNIFDYSKQVGMNSLLNTPPTFA